MAFQDAGRNRPKARFFQLGEGSPLQAGREHGVPCQICGKLIVATRDEEIPRLRSVLERGQAEIRAGVQVIVSTGTPF